ncbi:MAG: GAF domain-containing protein [Blastochloris sp.]|nr:GAF domain-containing protein [Blastochloris sp.]
MMLFITTVLIALVAYLAWQLFLSKKENDAQKLQFTKLQEEKKVVFDLLHDLGEAFSEEIDQNQLLHIILSSTLRVTGARGAIVYLLNPNQTQLEVSSVIGLFPPPVSLPIEAESKIATREEYLETVLRSEPIPYPSDNILAQTLNTEDGLLLPQAHSDPRFPNFHEPALQVGSFLAVPLRYRSEKLGILALSNNRSGASFNPDDLEIVRSIAYQASFSLHNARVFNQLAENNVSTATWTPPAKSSASSSRKSAPAWTATKSPP